MKPEENNAYVIPPNYVDTGTVFGGTIKLRNAAEAVALSLLIGIPVFQLPFKLTTKIIICCLTVLPAALLAVIGINGDSLTGFLFSFILYLKKRRIVGGEDASSQTTPKESSSGTKAQKVSSPSKKRRREARVKPKKEDFPEEFGQLKERKASFKKAAGSQPKKNGKRLFQKSPAEASETKTDLEKPPLNPAASCLPIREIKNGIIYTKDHRYVKIVEISPINFLLRSAREQQNIIYSFVSFLKISPVKLQFKVLTRRADINRHLETLHREMENETDERCLALQRDYENLIRQIGSREAITRRFFLIFEYEPLAANRNNDEGHAIAALETAVQTAQTYLRQCGNELLTPDHPDEMAAEVFYSVLNRRASVTKSLQVRINEVIGQYLNADRRDDLDHIPVTEFIAPESIDFTHGNYIVMDGVYHTYLLISSGGYRSQVYAGWTSLIVNAGEGIDMDLFLFRQPKDRIQQKLGQQLRINRSKIKDTSDTNSDFDDLDSAITSGYYLKEGLASNEDFYYMNILITVTAGSLDELEWRSGEMKKLLLSQDLEAATCHFREEAAFLSSLPLASLDKKLFERSKRNVLTSGAASCYPFVSFEMCDDNGILLGVNKHNNCATCSPLKRRRTELFLISSVN